jgi:putative flippase GtrA
LINQILRYIVVGGFGTIAHYVILITAVEVLSIAVTIASTLGFCVGAIVNYILNYHFTFSSTKTHISAAPRFFLIALIGACLNLLVIYLLTTILELHYLLSQIIATVIVLFWGFFANKFWTF